MRVGIVGAGAAGSGAAYALRDADATVTIVEKSGGVCGRAATRRKHGCHYDYGANYLKEADDRTASLLSSLGTDGLVDIESPVWTFDGAGDIAAGDDRSSHKWTWTEGMTQLAKRLLARTDATVHRRTRVTELTRDGGSDTSRRRWTLVDEDGERYGPFDVVLLTPPAPQTAELLRATDWPDDRLDRLRDAVEAVPYRTIRTVVLHYPFRESYPWYGLVNTDKAHAIGWLSREECKDGHVPDGESLLIVQMGPEWSTARYDEGLDDILPDVTERVAALLDDDRYRDPDWIDDQGWRYALPDSGLETAAGAATDAGLYVAGDWVAGEGRVERALWNGHETGERIKEANW
ncbi:NAD(P)/FAD-dependent oxidoreductase [Halobellus ordinarius]|uniref:NAD(P)/FAD-dependent oxidoreductase n=1 Tax=Halobellus ordinarius TaxID=3075120 RepID=UPI0028801B2A|nr:FAD-dependent oxidoreductase [Halobellus sp. ZY16]